MLIASLSAELEKVRQGNAHLLAPTNQRSTSDDRDMLNRKLTYLHNQNGTLHRERHKPNLVFYLYLTFG